MKKLIKLFLSQLSPGSLCPGCKNGYLHWVSDGPRGQVLQCPKCSSTYRDC